MRSLLFMSILAACHAEPEVHAPTPAASAGLATSEVAKRAPAGALTLSGELLPWQRVDLRARLPAFVAERRVDVGDVVAKGDVLVRLSAPDRVAERAAVEADLAAAEARQRRLEDAARSEGAVAPLEIESVGAEVDSLAARVRALRELEAELTVRAPFPGVVAARGADVGALVGGGGDAPLVTLVESGRLRVVAHVPEAWVGAASVRREVGFRVAGEGEARTGTIARTSGALDPRSRTLRVELDVDNADHALLPGRAVDVLWPLDADGEQLFVPATALVRTTEGTWVWAVRNGSLVRVEVDEQLREGTDVAVSGALEPGDHVVTRGSEDLVEGPLARAP